MSLSTGQSLGPYTILAPLGAGGMGGGLSRTRCTFEPRRRDQSHSFQRRGQPGGWHGSSASPTRFGTGQPTSISPDGRWVLAVPVDGHPLFLHPTGPGASRTLCADLVDPPVSPDGTRVVVKDDHGSAV